MFLLDTDIIIYSLKGNPIVTDNFRRHAKDPKALSVITYGELIYGASKSQQASKNLAKAHRIRETFPVIDLTCAIMDTYGALKAELNRKGTSINDFDLLIASTAISLDYCIVSNNEKHFNKISDLKVVNWSRKTTE
jgi:tRNA(fMet)-specific endonuclease VapC